MPDIPVEFPAGYGTGTAVGYTDDSGNIVLVEDDKPLPVVLSPATTPAPIAGTADEPVLVGPYAPVAGPPVVIQLTGEWFGIVTLLRSTDGGTTLVPITLGGRAWGVFTTNACEQVWVEHEAAAELYLQLEIWDGTLAYRVSQ